MILDTLWANLKGIVLENRVYIKVSDNDYIRTKYTLTQLQKWRKEHAIRNSSKSKPRNK